MANRSKWEEMTSTVKEAFSPKVEPYKETKEKRSTVEQVKDDREATAKEMKRLGID